jgi:hypothetical protein
MLVILATWEAEIRRIVIGGDLCETPIFKITRAKVDSSVRMPEALSSDPSPNPPKLLLK